MADKGPFQQVLQHMFKNTNDSKYFIERLGEDIPLILLKRPNNIFLFS